MKSHFTFTKQQRNGIFLLLVLIVVLQCAYFFIDFSSKEIVVDEKAINAFSKELDSLKAIEIESRKPKIYPFNPNFISDYKGASLGMSNEEIDRLLKFRSEGKWINSTQEFQEVTKISDSLLVAISKYFKFPEWVTNTTLNANKDLPKLKVSKTYKQKIDLNKATSQQLQTVNGVGEVLSKRIVKYRNKFVGGFIADVQLNYIYGLTPEVVERITKEFTVKTPRPITKIKINSASIDELVTVQYIDYDIAYNIIEERTLREGYKNIEELTKVKDFPVNKLEIIGLYLLFD
ncbi:helix-hairpin-helix domain-containing protein [Seonamhaeicola sp. ML3]|uniref:ComEA family DNA-binding protein n=1 Tax=Seonamhaeicola sp. ML3 TaxID=2937786 RepID=UPI00200FB1C2|nr:helix-hairpin-helix domain-containing protein [Seonamhaeicola sp. ML3]